jgi:Outer membrane protein beta-barrel domain
MLRQFAALRMVARGYHRRMALQHPLLALAGIVALSAATPAAAQNAVTLYGGARGGSGFQQTAPPNDAVDMNSSAAGSIGIEWPYDAARPLQLFLSYQRTKLDLGNSATPGSPTEMPLQVIYLHLGGLNFFEGRGGRGPYVVGGVGATYLNPGLQGTSSRVRPSFNVGLGYEWPLSPSLALRTELRGYITLINSSGSFFCSGGCVVSIRGDAMTQFEGMVGLTFGF